MITLFVLLAACASDGPAPAPAAPPAAPPPPTAAAAPCPLGDAGTWDACEGQVVRIEGTAPTMVNNHPLMAGMGPPGTPSLVQAYIDTAGGAQVVLITTREPGCTGAMVATGTLRHVDLGGAEGTPESYQGWRLDGAETECR